MVLSYHPRCVGIPFFATLQQDKRVLLHALCRFWFVNPAGVDVPRSVHFRFETPSLNRWVATSPILSLLQ